MATVLLLHVIDENRCFSLISDLGCWLKGAETSKISSLKEASFEGSPLSNASHQKIVAGSSFLHPMFLLPVLQEIS